MFSFIISSLNSVSISFKIYCFLMSVIFYKQISYDLLILLMQRLNASESESIIVLEKCNKRVNINY